MSERFDHAIDSTRGEPDRQLLDQRSTAGWELVAVTIDSPPYGKAHTFTLFWKRKFG